MIKIIDNDAIEKYEVGYVTHSVELAESGTELAARIGMIGVGMQRRNLALPRTALLHVRHAPDSADRWEEVGRVAQTALEIAAVEIGAVGHRRRNAAAAVESASAASAASAALATAAAPVEPFSVA